MQHPHAGEGHANSVAAASGRFTLRRTVHGSWVIVHARIPEFAVRPLAHITIDADDVAEVVWTGPVPLPVSYATPEDALESLEEWERGRPGAAKPVPIPHFPPRGGFRRANA
jgi:hypothetical protein